MNRRPYEILIAAALGIGLLTGCNNNINSSGSEEGPVIVEQSTGQSTKQEATELEETTTVPREFLITEEITSLSIADHNMLGDSGLEKIYIYLPRIIMTHRRPIRWCTIFMASERHPDHSCRVLHRIWTVFLLRERKPLLWSKSQATDPQAVPSM